MVARCMVSDKGNACLVYRNVSNCISLSPYLLDVIVISRISPPMLVKQANDDGERCERRPALA